MINRVLIRIKVVQLLYSYLLTENQFMLESQPSAPTKEKRFAYALYLDMLVLMVRLAERVSERRGVYYPLLETRFIKKLNADDKIKALLTKYADGSFPMEELVGPLADKIKDSGLYKNFYKDGGAENPANDGIWRELFNIIIYPAEEVTALNEKREHHTLRGVERMRNMMEETFKNFFASQDNLYDALNTLETSLNKARELYMRLLVLPVDLTHLRARQIEDNRHKYLPTDEDLNPNMRFVDNELIERIECDEKIRQYFEKHKFSWTAEEPHMLDRLLKDIMASEVYDDYMRFPATDLYTDCEFWRNIYKYVLYENETFLETLEDKSVFWNDDLDVIGTFVLKTFKRFDDPNAEVAPVLDQYKDEEDARFGAELFTAVMRNKDTYRSLIRDAVKHTSWTDDRLAFMDVVIIMTALGEILNFPKIPISVSVNEYVEMAKVYSTHRSDKFVNGVLGAIINRLQNEGFLDK
ncbi:MAG: transcription antitermination protein NusB [Muribaculaceae bacterium]|nr:transcription antitermination protein NusB [Muribaculaceae bacterium]